MQSQLAEVETDEDASAALTPEKQLLAAVIRRAVLDFVLYHGYSKNAEHRECASQAAGWLFWDGAEKIDDCGRMSFIYACSSLNLRPEVIRRQALKMRREGLYAGQD